MMLCLGFWYKLNRVGFINLWKIDMLFKKINFLLFIALLLSACLTKKDLAKGVKEPTQKVKTPVKDFENNKDSRFVCLNKLNAEPKDIRKYYLLYFGSFGQFLLDMQNYFAEIGESKVRE